MDEYIEEYNRILEGTNFVVKIRDQIGYLESAERFEEEIKYINIINNYDDEHHESYNLVLKINDTKKTVIIYEDIYSDVYMRYEIDEEKYKLIKKIIEKTIELLKKQYKNNADEEDKYQIEKHHFKKVLGIDKINEEVMLKYYKKTGVINNFASLIDIQNMRRSNDQSDLLKIKKIEIINNLLKELGYTSVMDKQLIEKETISNKINELIETNKFFNCSKERDLLFPSIKDRLNTFKSIMSYMNSIFCNYGFNLQRVRIRDRKKSVNKIDNYKIELLNGIDEIIKFRIAQNYKFYDSNNLILLNNKFIDDRVVLWKDLAPQKIVDNEKIIFIKKDKIVYINTENDNTNLDIDYELNYDFDNLYDNTQKTNDIINIL